MHNTWNQIEEASRPAVEVDLPIIDPATGGSVGRVLMRELTQAELQAANADAERYTRDKLKDVVPGNADECRGYDAIFDNALALNIIVRAVVDPDARDLLFPSALEAGKVLTQDTLGILMRLYLICQKQRGPEDGIMTAAEVDEWIAQLGGPRGNVEGLSLLSTEELHALVMELAKRRHAQVKA